jgi:hypothetical protein
VGLVEVLRVHLALAVEEMAWELPEGEASMSVLVADARRLAGTCTCTCPF